MSPAPCLLLTKTRCLTEQVAEQVQSLDQETVQEGSKHGLAEDQEIVLTHPWTSAKLDHHLLPTPNVNHQMVLVMKPDPKICQ